MKGKITQLEITQKQLKIINVIMTVSMSLMILSYFTVSENITITRGTKILLRMGMTGVIILLYRWMIAKGHVGSFFTHNKLAVYLYYAYLLLGLISLLWTTNLQYSTLQLIMTSESLLFVLYYMKVYNMLRHYYSNLNRFRLSAYISNGIVYIQIVFVAGWFLWPDTFIRLTHGGTEARLGGFLMNPNELGMLAAVGMACAFYEIQKSTRKWLVWIFIAVDLYAIILTGSRSTLIGVFLVVYYYISKTNAAWVKYATYVGMVAAIPVVIQKIFIKAGDASEVLSMTGRLPFWSALIQEGMIKEPWLGFGFMRIAHAEYFQGRHTYPGKMTHNTFMQVLMNLGWVGVTICFSQMAYAIRGMIKEKEDEIKTIFVGIGIPIFINSLTEFGIFGETNFGILFYQIIIYYIAIKFYPKLTKSEKFKLRKLGRKLYGKDLILGSETTSIKVHDWHKE